MNAATATGGEAGALNGEEEHAQSERQSLRIASVIFAAGALAAYALAVVDLVSPVPGYSAPGLVFFASTAAFVCLFFVFMWWRRLRMPTWAWFGFWMAGIVLTNVGQFLAAAPPSFAPMQAGLLCVFGAAFLPRRQAATCVVCFGIAVGILFWTQDGWNPPIAFWLVAMIVTIACTIVVAQLVDRADREAARANAAIAQLQDLNATLEERVADQVSEIQASRARIVAVADEERRRMERDLHDGAQQHLVMLRLQLSRIAKALESDPEQALTRLAETSATLADAQAELRNLAHGIYPATLESAGLPAALAEAARRSPMPIQVHSDGVGRLSRDTEAALYFCCLEALQNVGKYAGPDATATVRLARSVQRIEFAVVDTGRGFEVGATGQGLTNMRDRLGALGGDVTVTSAPGAGTAVTGWVPLTVSTGNPEAVPRPDRPGA